jgi:hypothetical protein
MLRGNLTGRPELWTPRVEMAIGRDMFSAGLTVVSYGSNEHRQIEQHELMALRWRNAPQSTEECLRVAVRGLTDYLREAGYDSV